MKGKLGSLKCHLLAGASAIGMLTVGTAGASAATPDELEGAIKAMQAQIAVLQKQVEEARAMPPLLKPLRSRPPYLKRMSVST